MPDKSQLKSAAPVVMDRVFVISALANLVAAYNLAITGHLLLLIQLSGSTPSDLEDGYVASAAILGAVFGQVAFGYLGQRCMSISMGLGLALFLCTLGNVAGAFLSWQPILFPTLAFFRFLSGLGAGGVYPLSAVASAETSQDASSRGRRMMLVFSLQGVGQILASLVIVILAAMLPDAPSASWRSALFLGAIPSSIAAWMAVTLDTNVNVPAHHQQGFHRQDSVDRSATAAATSVDGVSQENNSIDLHVEGSGAGVVSRSNSLSSLDASLSAVYSSESIFTWRNLFLLVGTAGSWFVFDVVFYGNLIFTPFMLTRVFDLDKNNPHILQVAGHSCLIMVCAWPGLLLASVYSDRLGRKNIQLIGFSMCFVLFIWLAMTYHALSNGWLFFFYLSTFFFYNFGPNATTFCLPAETFHPNCRVIFNGISAACGKAGAVVGASIFAFVLDEDGLKGVLIGCAALSLIGVIVTVVFVQDMRGKSLGNTPMAVELIETAPAPQMDDHERAAVADRVALV